MKTIVKARTLSRATHHLLGGAMLMILTHGQTRAAVVVDFSPDTAGASVGGGSWTNRYGFQIVGDQFTLLEETTITGAAIFSDSTFGTVGHSMRFLIFDDVAGIPAPTPIIDLTTTLDAVDSLFTATTSILTRKHATITPTVLSAGTYWFSMPGDGLDITQATDNSGASRFGATTLSIEDAIGDMFFQLEGTPASIPEPSSALLFGLGALGIFAGRRRH